MSEIEETTLDDQLEPEDNAGETAVAECERDDVSEECFDSEHDDVLDDVHGDVHEAGVIEDELADEELAIEEGAPILMIAPIPQVVEAALMAAGKPLTLEHLAALFDEGDRPDKPTLRQTLIDLAESCDGRGFELKEIASGWRFQVRQDLSPWVGRLWDEKPQRYTRALLETLALIAYRQPITRGEIEDIRGVSVSTNIVRTLQEREWVRVVGHRDVPGRPAMYATTRQFLDYFGLRNLDQLPPLSELRDLDAMAKQLEGGAEGVAQPELSLGDDTEAPAGEASAGEGSAAEGDASATDGVGEEAATEQDAASLVSVEEAQAFQEEGNEKIDKLFAELDDMEGDLTLTYKDYSFEEGMPEGMASEQSSPEKVEPEEGGQDESLEMQSDTPARADDDRITDEEESPSGEDPSSDTNH